MIAYVIYDAVQLPFAGDRFVVRNAPEGEGRPDAMGWIPWIIAVDHPEESQPENAHFADSASVPVTHDGQVFADASKRKSVIPSVKRSISGGVEDTKKGLPEDADFAGTRPGPVADHRKVAWNAAK